MYIVEDRVTPTIGAYMNGLAFKNKFLRTFPTETMGDGTVVFGNFYVYSNDAVHKTDTDLKIYKLLGINPNDINKSDFKGVKSYWVGLSPQFTSYDLTLTELKNYINNNSSIDVAYKEEVVYDPIDTDAPRYVTDIQIIDLLKSKFYYANFPAEDSFPLVALALLDTNSVLFDISIKVNTKTLSDPIIINGRTYNQVSPKLLRANTTLTITRKTDVEDVTVQTYLNNVIAHIASIRTGYTSTFNRYTYTVSSPMLVSVYDKEVSVNKQLLYMVSTMNPAYDSNLVYFDIVTGYRIKYEGLRNIKSTLFGETVSTLLKSDYKRDRGSPLERFIGAVVSLALIAVALVTYQYQFFAYYVVGATLALATLSYIFAKSGDYGMTSIIGKSIQMFSVATAMISFGANISKFSNTITAVSLKDITLDTITSTIKDAFDVVVEKAITSPMMFISDTLNTVFKVYTEIINPVDSTTSSQKELDKTREELDSLSSPDTIDNVRRIMSDRYSNIYDANEVLDNVPYLMTQGRIDNAMTKYYK